MSLTNSGGMGRLWWQGELAPQTADAFTGDFHAGAQGNEDEGVEGIVEVVEDEAQGVAGGFGIEVVQGGEYDQVANVFDGGADEDKDGIVVKGVSPGGAGGEGPGPAGQGGGEPARREGRHS